MESNSVTNADNPHVESLLSHLLGLGPRFLLFYTASFTHSCLKSLYCLPFLNPHKNFMRATCNSFQNSPRFSHNRFYEVRGKSMKFLCEDCIKPRIFCLSPQANSSFFDLTPDLSCECSRAAFLPITGIRGKTRKGDNGQN